MTDWEEKNVVDAISQKQERNRVKVKSLADIISKKLSDTSGLQFARDARYRCLTCLDTAWVSIWSPETIAAAIATEGQPERWATCMAKCTCENGIQEPTHFTKGPRAGEPIPVFGDQEWHINAKGPDAKAQACMAQPIVDHPNYYDEF